MVENVDEREPRLLTLAVVSSDNYLPLKTQNLILNSGRKKRKDVLKAIQQKMVTLLQVTIIFI